MAISKKNKLLIITGSIFTCVTATAIWLNSQKQTSATDTLQKPVPVRILDLKSQTLPITTAATGYLQAKESVVITPRVAGYIQSIPFKSGAIVTKGQTIFQLDNNKEKDALAAAIANNKLSQLQYQRDKTLLKKGFITEDQYFNAKVSMKQNAATLQSAKTSLSDKTIIAPFNGELGAITNSVGDYISPGQQLTKLVDENILRVAYTLPARALSQIKLNQPVTVTADATKSTVNGVVTFISPTIDQATQTITLHARINNKNHQFKPGEFVTITQHTGTNKAAILVPESSIQGSMNGYFVYIVKNGKAIQIPVKIASHKNGFIVVTSGLKVHDHVIIAGQLQVHDGQPVTINA